MRSTESSKLQESDKLLFLDVDGVLNTTRSKSLYSLSKPLLRRLEGIVRDTNCRIILSSTWRKDAHALRVLKRALKYRGVRIQGFTPVIHNKSRGHEIEAYLTDCPYLYSRYAILDDNSDMLDTQLPNFFQTDEDYGLTETIAYRVVYHLNRK